MQALQAPRALAPSLLALRIGIVVLMLPWALDKLVRPDHALAVMQNFYLIGDVGLTAVYVLGALQLAVLAAFAAGLAKTWTYGLMLAMHGVSTLSTWREFLSPYEGSNLLLFAAWPTLGACLALFLLRDYDVLLSAPSRKAALAA